MICRAIKQHDSRDCEHASFFKRDDLTVQCSCCDESVSAIMLAQSPDNYLSLCGFSMIHLLGQLEVGDVWPYNDEFLRTFIAKRNGQKS